jgi:predicted glycosyltransferase
MHYLFFMNTPAHVHLYKHAVRRLRGRGHETSILARDYGCTRQLLDWEGLSHTVYGRCGTDRRSLFTNLPAHYLRIARTVRRLDPDLVFGMGAYGAHAGLLSRTPSVLVLDSEPTSLDHTVSTPFARAILTPAAFRKNLGADHYTFDGFKESAYLHPSAFEHDPTIRADLDVGPAEPYVVVRLNAFGSHHDVGEGGFGPGTRESLIERLAEHATVFVSDEDGSLDLSALPARTFDLHPGRIHGALAEASLLVADTQTMVTEAALLGTPAIRSNSFVGDNDMGNFQELAAAGLVINVADPETVSQEAVSLLADPNTGRAWRERRDDYVADMVDLTSVLVDVAESPDAIETVPGLTPARPRSERARSPQHVR